MKSKVRVVEVEFELDGRWVHQHIETVPVYVDHSDYFYLDKNVPISTSYPPEEMRGIRPGDILTIEITKD